MKILTKKEAEQIARNINKRMAAHIRLGKEKGRGIR